MPEEVTDQPRVYLQIEGYKNLYRESERDVETLTPSEYRKIVIESREALLRKLPHLTSEINDIYNLAYNVLLATEAQGPEDVATKIIGAQVQHNLVHNIVFASTAYPTPDRKDIQNYARNVFLVAEHTERVSTRFNAFERTASKFISGVKAELAIIKALVDENFPVYVPDYSQMVGDLGQNEIYQFDVLSGIDFFTLVERRNGVVAVLVNAKGLALEEMVHVKREDSSRVNNFVENTLKQYGVTEIVRARITIPTSGLGFGNMDFRTPIDYQREIGKYCDLSLSSKDAIVGGVENIARMELIRK